MDLTTDKVLYNGYEKDFFLTFKFVLISFGYITLIHENISNRIFPNENSYEHIYNTDIKLENI